MNDREHEWRKVTFNLRNAQGKDIASQCFERAWFTFKGAFTVVHEPNDKETWLPTSHINKIVTEEVPDGGVI